MKAILTQAHKYHLVHLFSLLALGLFAGKATAQCATGIAPAYSATCATDWFKSINATGIGVTSTIAAGLPSCTTTYINDFATQGITTNGGNTVSVNIVRQTGYTAYLSVYIDWNNNGTFDLSELCGMMMTLPVSTSTTTYTFTVPVTGVVTGTNLNMRLFMSELATGAPCTANYGQTYDFYFNVPCVPPTITVAPSNDTICPGASMALTASGAGLGGTYTWSPSLGLSATTGATVTASPTVAVTYIVTGTTGIGGCKSTALDTIGVKPITITAAPSRDSLCDGSSVTLTASGAGIGGAYTWVPSTGLSATTGDVVVASPTVDITYTVTGTTSSGCTNSARDTIIIIPSPAIPLDTALGKTKFCFGDSVLLKDTTRISGCTYQWYLNAGAILGATDTSYMAKASGSYTIGAINARGCVTQSAPIIVNAIKVAPVVTFDGKVFRTAKYYTTYQWYENKIAISGATFDSLIAHSNGSYQVKVTDTNGCSDTSITYVLKKLQIENTLNSSEIRIYPNPANNVIHIECPVAVDAVITGIEGKIISKQKDARDINITNLPTGIYFIDLADESGHRLTIQKLIKN